MTTQETIDGDAHRAYLLVAADDYIPTQALDPDDVIVIADTCDAIGVGLAAIGRVPAGPCSPDEMDARFAKAMADTLSEARAIVATGRVSVVHFVSSREFMARWLRAQDHHDVAAQLEADAGRVIVVAAGGVLLAPLPGTETTAAPRTGA